MKTVTCCAALLLTCFAVTLRAEDAAQRAIMVDHAQLALEHAPDAPQRPPLRGKAGRQGPGGQMPGQLGPLRVGQPGEWYFMKFFKEDALASI